MKTIALFGGTGRTGRLVLEILVRNNYHIKVLVRDISKISIRNENIEYITGDILNLNDVQNVIQNSHAVISTIGYVKDSKSGFQEMAMKNIILSMNAFGVKRIVIQTGTGVYFQGDKFSIGNFLLTQIIKIVAPNRFNDGVAQCKLLIDSELDYTIVRTPLLTDESNNGIYKSGNICIGFFSRIGRMDVAKFIVSQLSSNQFYIKAPIIRY